MNKAELELRHQQWINRFSEELEKAPPGFYHAFEVFESRQIHEARELFENCISERLWPGSASSILAYLLAKSGKYIEAMQYTKRAAQYGIELPGYWYYFTAIIKSQNRTDQFQLCRKTIDDAIDFFKSVDSPCDVCNFHFVKANVLKQMAAPYSHIADENSLAKAKELAIEAIHSICQSLEIDSDGWEELENEVNIINKIAARAGVKESDLHFLKEMADIRDITQRFFSDSRLANDAFHACFGEADLKIKEGLREEAVFWFRQAILTAREGPPFTTALKGLMAYEAGEKILELYNEEINNPKGNYSPRRKAIIEDIRYFWRIAFNIYSQIDNEILKEFDKAFQPGLKWAALKIKYHDLMLD